jgi:hypothetical protein
MTERKPEGVSWQSWIERQIQEAQHSGAFDDLDGHGQPIEGLDTVHDEMWWVKAKLRDEEINALPPTIAIRAERARAMQAALVAATEDEARSLIEAVNQRIRYVNSHATSGPPSSVATIDPEQVVEGWRAERPMPPPVEPEHADASSTPQMPRRPRWRSLPRRHGSGH